MQQVDANINQAKVVGQQKAGTFSAVQTSRNVLFYGFMILLSLIFAGPLIWMISTSLKTDPQVFTVPPIWIPNPVRFANYPEALTGRPFGLFTLNTLRYALTSVLGVLISSTLSPMAFREFTGRAGMSFLSSASRP